MKIGNIMMNIIILIVFFNSGYVIYVLNLIIKCVIGYNYILVLMNFIVMDNFYLY